MIKKIFANFFLLIILISCSSDDDAPVPNIPDGDNSEVLSDKNDISSFKLIVNDQIFSGIINQDDKTITFDLIGANLTSLTPTIEYADKASISPEENVPQNFNEQVSYTIYAENGDSSVYRVVINNRPLSSENKILEFSINVNNEIIKATINEELKEIEFDVINTNLNSILPQIKISDYASIIPNLETPIDFNKPISYTVIAENGDQKIYKVYVNRPKIKTIGSRYFGSKLVYSNAELWIIGKFIDPSLENVSVYLTDGNQNFPLQILSTESYESQNSTIHNLFVKMPDGIPSNENYKVVYQNNNFVTESEGVLNVLSENVPVIQSLDKPMYNVDDTVVITGVNLTDQLTIPNDGSVYIVNDCCNDLYSYRMNVERTEVRFKLIRQVYGWSGSRESTITLLSSDRRVGETVTTQFGS